VRRKREQRKRREAARQQARALIEDWLEERSVEITAEELAKRTYAGHNAEQDAPCHGAHPLRRASAILQHATSAWHETTLRLRRAYIALNEDAPFTTDLAARASRS
jgi:hypothetical protein